MNCIIFFKGFRGEAYDGVNILEKSLESVRKEVERYAFASLQSTIHDVLLRMSTTWVCRCDQFLGTCLVHSVAGGTGSGTVQCPDSPESTLTAPSANARPSVSANTIDIDIRPSRRLRLAARGGAARRVPAGVPALSSGGAEPSDVRLADAALQRGALSRSTRPVRAFCCCSSIRRDTCCPQCSDALCVRPVKSCAILCSYSDCVLYFDNDELEHMIHCRLQRGDVDLIGQNQSLFRCTVLYITIYM